MSKFVVILAILTVFGAVLVEGFDKQAALSELLNKVNACKVEVGAKDADVEELVAKKPASTAEGKCMRSCLMKKLGVMDANGKIIKDAAVKRAENASDGDAGKMKIAHEMIDACAALSVSDDHCEAAAQYCKCFKEQALAHGITDLQM